MLKGISSEGLVSGRIQQAGEGTKAFGQQGFCGTEARKLMSSGCGRRTTRERRKENAGSNLGPEKHPAPRLYAIQPEPSLGLVRRRRASGG